MAGSVRQAGQGQPHGEYRGLGGGHVVTPDILVALAGNITSAIKELESRDYPVVDRRGR